MITIRIHKIFYKLYPCLTICTTNRTYPFRNSQATETRKIFYCFRKIIIESVKHKILIASPFNNFFNHKQHSANKRHFFSIFLNVLFFNYYDEHTSYMLNEPNYRRIKRRNEKLIKLYTRKTEVEFIMSSIVL